MWPGSVAGEGDFVWLLLDENSVWSDNWRTASEGRLTTLWFPSTDSLDAYRFIQDKTGKCVFIWKNHVSVITFNQQRLNQSLQV